MTLVLYLSLIAGASPVDFGVAVPPMVALTATTILLFTRLRVGLDLTRREGVWLLAAYALFVGWMILETFDVTDWIPGA